MKTNIVDEAREYLKDVRGVQPSAHHLCVALVEAVDASKGERMKRLTEELISTRNQLHAVIAQRDQLAEALDYLLRQAQSGTHGLPNHNDAVMKARTALAELEKENGK